MTSCTSKAGIMNAHKGWGLNVAKGSHFKMAIEFLRQDAEPTDCLVADI